MNQTEIRVVGYKSERPFRYNSLGIVDEPRKGMADYAGGKECYENGFRTALFKFRVDLHHAREVASPVDVGSALLAHYAFSLACDSPSSSLVQWVIDTKGWDSTPTQLVRALVNMVAEKLPPECARVMRRTADLILSVGLAEEAVDISR